MDAKLRSPLCRFQSDSCKVTDRWTDDVQINTQTEKQMDRHINGLTNGQPGKRIERQIDRRTLKQIDRKKDGQIKIYRQTNGWSD